MTETLHLLPACWPSVPVVTSSGPLVVDAVYVILVAVASPPAKNRFTD
jgi:hypothetical protein